MMRNIKFNLFAAAMALLFVQGCTNDTTVDLREHDYGYVQFKLYKAASYPSQTISSRAEDDFELDFLSQACKVDVALYGENGRQFNQSLVLNSADKELAEYGLRSSKLKLLAGKYRIGGVKLFDTMDKLIYDQSIAPEQEFEVVESGLTVHDVTINVKPRGFVKFSLVKEMSSITPPAVRSVERDDEYTFDEIKSVDISLKSVTASGGVIGGEIKLTGLPAKFSQHFDEDKNGWKTSSIECDTLISLEAGKYRVMSYKTYASTKSEMLLEVNTEPTLVEFTVADNKTTETSVKVSLYETDEYIKDYYALYEIWNSLGGKNWYYDGENYPRGTNWNFNKDVDLWGEQPGVQIHSNGRVAYIDLSGFGIEGELSPKIGQLSELVELYLGTHNDTNVTYDPSLDFKRSLAERTRNRFNDQRKYLQSIHTPIQMSEPCARALMEKGLTSPAISLYEKNYKESDIIDRATGKQKQIVKQDMNYGTLVNGLTKLPDEIGELEKLEKLYIANGRLKELPATFCNLKSLTDLEIYNCQYMTEFPDIIAELPSLVSVNISNNKQWDTEDMNEGFTKLAQGKSRKTIEILYARQNKLSKLTKAMFGASSNGLEKIGLLDLAFNEIAEVEALGKEVAFIQLYLDNNKIEKLPCDAEGYFCNFDDVETFSVNYNKLTMIPNIFNAKSTETMTSVSFAGNQIGSKGIICEGENDGSYKGIRVQTLTLSMNPMKRYPKAFADSNSLFEYIILSACQIENIEEGSFSHKNAINHFSFDFSYNYLKKLPKDWHAGNMPYLYGVDLSFNSFEEFPWAPLDSESLTVFAVRSQRNAEGVRCLKSWPQGIYQHKGLRGLYLGSNDLRKVDDTISTLCYYLDISDNPNIIFDASDICYAWQVGAYILYYDKDQTILNCDVMLQ